jgi:hypothetical protein
MVMHEILQVCLTHKISKLWSKLLNLWWKLFFKFVLAFWLDQFCLYWLEDSLVFILIRKLIQSGKLIRYQKPVYIKYIKPV